MLPERTGLQENKVRASDWLGPDPDPPLQRTLSQMDLTPLSDHLQRLDFPKSLVTHVLIQVTGFLLRPWHDRGGTSMSSHAVIFESDVGSMEPRSTLEPGPSMDDMLLDGQVETDWDSAVTLRTPPPPLRIPVNSMATPPLQLPPRRQLPPDWFRN